MNKTFHDRGFSDYVYWANHDRKTFNRINALLQDIERNGVSKGIGNLRNFAIVTVGHAALTSKTA